ncbi:hypothetical protein HPB49_022254 [Dermacentor silvarum]|uniref:Uncharacterized protein n=1 Tax=Dermacentor silvarum TaxID=543639 RepID=A0ACB8CHT4_DERSI|nr:hypothetical protein HPB49_022254 [Dermacentor silvarum]
MVEKIEFPGLGGTTERELICCHSVKTVAEWPTNCCLSVIFRSKALFPRFQGREVRHLRDDSEFLAFAAGVGRQMSAMVDSVNDYDALCEVARKNAADHAQREGVHAGHFEHFFSVTLGEMTESDESAMTPAAVAAWEKFFVVSTCRLLYALCKPARR